MKRADITCLKTEAIEVAREYGARGLCLTMSGPVDGDITRVTLLFSKFRDAPVTPESNAEIADGMLRLLGKHES